MTEILNLGRSQYHKSYHFLPDIKLKIHHEFDAQYKYLKSLYEFDPNSEGLTQAVCLLDLPDNRFTPLAIKQAIEEMIQKDDVFNESFVSTLILRNSPLMALLSLPELKETLNSAGFPLARLAHYESSSTIPPGPYLLSYGKLYPALKLCPDPYGAFVCGMLQSKDDKSNYTLSPFREISIPSRLSFPSPTSSLPLAGKRIAVKDIFSIRNIRTTACSKSYESCWLPAQKTASIVQKLMDMGAVIVGKTKTAQLASGLAARDWIDYQCPFNPRGDGYQDPDCSSSGSAVAVAAYEWLDCAVGSDTLGSMVGPAAVNGVYGIRPTHGLQERDGTILVSALFDTAGIFSRNIDDFLHITNVWYGQNNLTETRMNKFPSRILYPKERFDPYSEGGLEVMARFVSDLEHTTNVQKIPLDIATLWKQNPSAGTSKPINEFLETTLAHIQLYDCYHNNNIFRQMHSLGLGYEPNVEPMIRYKWNLGAKLTKDDYEKACSEREIFRKFLLEHVFTEGTIMLLPGGYPDVIYRDDYGESFEEHGHKFQGFGFKDTAFSVLGGLPCISFPVGQDTYHSKITNRKEYRPISLMLLGAPGTDSLLISLVKTVLEEHNRPLSVKVGNAAF